jgi:outer membrane protein
MKATKIIFSIIFELVFISQINAQEKITLSGAISIALNHNTSVVKSTNSLEVTNAAIKNAYGNLIPTLNLNSGWSWQRASNSQGTTVVNYFGEAQNLGATETDTRNYSLSLGGNFTLFDGLSNFSTINQKKNDLRSARYDLEKLQQDVIIQTINLFVTVLNNEKILNFQIEDQKYNRDMLNKVKEMFDLKMVANVDLYSQQYQSSNSQLAYLQAKSNYEKSKIALLNHLSKDVMKEYTFEMDSASQPEFVKSITSADSLYQIALNNRKDYQSQKSKLHSSDLQLTVARSGLYPSLSGNYSFSTSSTLPSDLFTRKVYNMGLSLNFPIFSHWNTDYVIQSAQIQIKNSREDLDALERQIKSDVKNAIIDLQTAKMQVEVTKSALKSSKETWSIKKDSYILGAATYIDQQQSYRDYIQASNNDITSESNYIYKQFSLLSALGLLKVE